MFDPSNYDLSKVINISSYFSSSSANSTFYEVMCSFTHTGQEGHSGLLNNETVVLLLGPPRNR